MRKMLSWFQLPKAGPSIWRVALVLAVAFVILGFGAMMMSKPELPPAAITTAKDATASTGSDYANLYVTDVANVISASVGKETVLRIVRFGGMNIEVWHDARVTREAAEELLLKVLTSEAYPNDIKGSPITMVGVQEAIQLAQRQVAGKKVLLIYTDGLEDGQMLMQLPTNPDAAKGVLVLILYSREADTRVGKTLKALGADVKVIQEPAAVKRELTQLLTGMTPLKRTLRSTGWTLPLSGTGHRHRGVSVEIAQG